MRIREKKFSLSRQFAAAFQSGEVHLNNSLQMAYEYLWPANVLAYGVHV
jgi:hypothetical protein